MDNSAAAAGCSKWHRLARAHLEGVRKRLDDACCVPDKPPVEVEQAQKALKLLDVGRRWVCLDGGDSRRFRLDARHRYHVAQELHLADSPDAFVRVDEQAIALQEM
jgi:hypothetical protein